MGADEIVFASDVVPEEGAEELVRGLESEQVPQLGKEPP
jgi:hypothetical protein